MPTYRVTGPDGATYRVTAPEGASEQEVIEYAQKQGASAAPPPKEEAKPSGPALSRTERFLTGLRDPMLGLTQAMTHMLPDSLNKYMVMDKNGLVQFNPDMSDEQARNATGMTADRVDQQISSMEKDYQARRGTDGFDGYRFAGNMASTAPLAAVAPGPGATLASTAVRSAATGAVTNSLQPVSNAGDTYWEQKGEQAGVGAATGAVMGPLFQAVSRMLSPRVDPAVAYLQERGVTPRVGQIIGPKAAVAEDKAMSLPIVGDKIAEAQRRAVEDFNRAAYNEVLKPLGQKYAGPVGRDGIAAVQDTLSKAYDDVLPNLQWKADPKFVAEFKKIAGMAQNLPPDKYTQFQKVMENELIPRVRGGGMDGLSFKELEAELSRFARSYGSSSSADDRMLANGINEVLASARSALERGNPKAAPLLRKINQAYATFTRVQDAAGRVGTEEGIFTPNHLLSAVRNMDKSARKGAFARGDALLQTLAENGKKVLGIKYPDSGTAGRLAEFGALAGVIANPALTVGGGVAGSLPYTKAGQDIAAKLLTQRSPWARPAGELLNSLAVRGGGIAGPLGVRFAGPPIEGR